MSTGGAMTMHVDIVSLEEEIYAGRARQLRANCVMGDVGIFPNHAPFLAQLAPGPVKIVKPNGEDEIIFVSGGILEVQPDIVTILADAVSRAADLDEAAIIQAQEAARNAMAEHKTDVDYSMARAELIRAAALMRTLQEIRRQIK